MKRSSHRKVKRSDQYLRRIGNQKYVNDPSIRPGARPPDAWDDFQVTPECKQYINHIQAMIKKGWDLEKIVDRVCAKWGLDRSFAEKEVAEWIEIMIERQPAEDE